MKPEITYTLLAEPEDLPVRGNAMASGDEELDRKVEDEIIARLERGDVWAWCCVKVTASVAFEGLTFEGHEYLGGCSYKDEAEFVAANDYLPDMRKAALEDLRGNLRRLIERAAVADKLLKSLVAS